ncbi:MAG: 50S ribosomal protein L2 [Candidatus Saganbacteria bacterium]|nr:50S ribosomal protein L2 [Candidatus Saganbacteria bacterium]
MALKQFRPRTPGTRTRIDLVLDDITTSKPERSLLLPLKGNAGRDSSGRVSVRHKGGGNKIKYRIVDFKRDKDDMPAKILSIEYDPNRNARICLIEYEDKERRYIIAPLGIKVGDTIMSGQDSDIKAGNNMPLKNIPVGTTIYNVELTRGKGGQIARSAGGSAVLNAKEGRFATVRLPSGEERLIDINCRACIGQVGNLDAKNISYGKAGRRRHLGIRPSVRGIAMNPCDHPHGGGEGRSPIGHPGPLTPWGKPTLGYKTRHKRKLSDRFILTRRKK